MILRENGRELLELKCEQVLKGYYQCSCNSVRFQVVGAHAFPMANNRNLELRALSLGCESCGKIQFFSINHIEQKFKELKKK